MEESTFASSVRGRSTLHSLAGRRCGRSRSRRHVKWAPLTLRLPTVHRRQLFSKREPEELTLIVSSFFGGTPSGGAGKPKKGKACFVQQKQAPRYFRFIWFCDPQGRWAILAAHGQSIKPSFFFFFLGPGQSPASSHVAELSLFVIYTTLPQSHTHALKVVFTRPSRRGASHAEIITPSLRASHVPQLPWVLQARRGPWIPRPSAKALPQCCWCSLRSTCSPRHSSRLSKW